MKTVSTSLFLVWTESKVFVEFLDCRMYLRPVIILFTFTRDFLSSSRPLVTPTGPKKCPKQRTGVSSRPLRFASSRYRDVTPISRLQRPPDFRHPVSVLLLSRQVFSDVLVVSEGTQKCTHNYSNIYTLLIRFLPSLGWFPSFFFFFFVRDPDCVRVLI